METPGRKYKIKDVDFIITSDTIIDSAIANQAFLETKRSTWTLLFFQAIRTQIDQATQDHLGVDNAKALRAATQVVYHIVAAAFIELAELKVQIEEDFKDNPAHVAEILNTLGFNKYLFDARKGDQEALINLLFQFKTNLTQQLNDEIVTKGTSQAKIDAVISRADALKDANVLQEGKKGTRKEITAAAVNEFNNIYEKIISITRISAKFFKTEKAKRDQFSFNNVSKTINKKSLNKKLV